MSGHYTRLNWCAKLQCRKSRLNKPLRNWLFDTGSLTARLIDHCPGTFSVRVLSVKRETPTPDEIDVLGMRPRSLAIVRQVQLYCDDTPLVYARTIIPVSSLRGPLRGLVQLGNRPLGALLFSDPCMQRLPMEVAALSVKSPIHRLTGYSGKQPISGRRSVFIMKKQKLLVSEFFLPGLVDGTQ